MGEHADAFKDTEQIKPSERLELVHVQAAVEPDGSEAIITLHTTEGQFDLSVQFDRMSAASVEIRRAGMIMLRRQMSRIDTARAAFDELVRSAPVPAKVVVTIDRETGDRVIIYRFPDRLPIIIRMSPEQVEGALEELAIEARKAAN